MPPGDKPRIEKLGPEHIVADFDCGNVALNRFLHRHALESQRGGGAQTYLAFTGDRIAGYYSLAVGQIEYDDAPERMTKGLAHHPVPTILIARLAVDQRFQGRGLGSGLLLDALRRIKTVAEIAGVRAAVVHAKDEHAKAFYEHFGFKAFLDKPLTLYRLLRDISLDER